MTNGASLKSFSGATNPSRKESSNMLKQNFSPTAGSAPVRGVGVGGANSTQKCVFNVKFKAAYL